MSFYDDQQTGMKANVDTLNLSLSGDISQKNQPSLILIILT